jgi:hypothetical protein
MPVIIAILSIIALGVSLLVPAFGDFAMLTGPIALACLYLLLRARFKGSAAPVEPSNPVVIDGSNVLFWRDNTPDIATVVAVVNALKAQGFKPGVIFDASAGYRIGERYQDDRELARRLGLPDEQVLVVPKGTIADQYVLMAARKLGARIVTNDRYRDWAAEFPEVATDGFMIKGGVRDGKVWLT